MNTWKEEGSTSSLHGEGDFLTAKISSRHPTYTPDPEQLPTVDLGLESSLTPPFDSSIGLINATSAAAPWRGRVRQLELHGELFNYMCHSIAAVVEDDAGYNGAFATSRPS